jgi:predicted phage gp36 major capsid-like protein
MFNNKNIFASTLADQFRTSSNWRKHKPNDIWREGMQAGSPPSLLGYPVEFDETMPDVAANSLSIAFGTSSLLT